MSTKKGRISLGAVDREVGRRIALPPHFVSLVGDIEQGNNALVHPSLRYIDTDHQCFSEWTSASLRAFSSFIKRVRQQTWQQLLASGGKGPNKVGFGFTVHKDKAVLPRRGQVPGVGEDVNLTLDLFELRVTQEARVHCFRHAQFLFLVWLDEHHEVYPG